MERFLPTVDLLSLLGLASRIDAVAADKCLQSPLVAEFLHNRLATSRIVMCVAPSLAKDYTALAATYEQRSPKRRKLHWDNRSCEVKTFLIGEDDPVVSQSTAFNQILCLGRILRSQQICFLHCVRVGAQGAFTKEDLQIAHMAFGYAIDAASIGDNSKANGWEVTDKARSLSPTDRQHLFNAL